MTVLSADESRSETVEALVDTEATYTWLPVSLLRRLGISPAFEREFQTADGRTIHRPVADALVQLNGEQHPTLVVFGDEETLPLLGVVTLETFSLGVDPVNQRLVPARGLALAGRRGGWERAPSGAQALRRSSNASMNSETWFENRPFSASSPIDKTCVFPYSHD